MKQDEARPLSTDTDPYPAAPLQLEKLVLHQSVPITRPVSSTS